MHETSTTSRPPDSSLVDARAAADAEPRTPPDGDRVALERLSRIAAEIAQERDPDRLVQRVTDEATRLVGAEFGAFFYNVVNAAGESFMLYTLSGVPREAFAGFPMPRNTAVFAPTFNGEGIVRSADITRDPRYGRNAPHAGMPKGHLPVRSYLAVPVKDSAGEVLGGLFFGHSAPGVFDEPGERALAALAPIVGTALSNARLFAALTAREAQLRQSEARYRLVSEAMQEGVWFWDVATNKVEWNDRLLELMGVTRQEWGGTFEDWFSRVHPEDQPRLSAALKDHLERRAPYRIDLFRLRHADGEYRFCTTAGQAEWDADGRPLRMAGSFRDITDRQRAQDQLRANEHRLAQILDSVEDIIFTKNDRLQVTWANAAACRYYGMTVEELRGITDVPFNQIDFTKQYNRDDREVFETGRRVERLDEPNLARDGETRMFHTVKTPVKDASGRVVELVGVSRDVTDRKRELDAQRLLAEASAILGGSIDYEATLANVARATVPRFADWSAVDLLGEDGTLKRVAVHHSDPEKVALAHELHAKYPPNLEAPRGVGLALRTKQVDFMEEIPDELLVATARDEEHLRISRALGLRSFVVAPILIGDRVVGAITFVSAESKRRYGEADRAFAVELARRAAVAIENATLYARVRELATTLERRVEQRTAALLESNKELEAFSYTVSHDLRAPVRHIGGFADLLRSSAGPRLDDKSLRYLETIKGAANQMGALIDGLLAFSRLGRAELTKQPVDLAALVAGIVRELEPDLTGRRVRFQIAALPEVSGDPTMLRLVLANLLGNAVKYTRVRPEAHIEVGCRRDDREVIVWVKDDGVGFNMQYAEKLFGVFQRLHAVEEFEGTGIGLATVRRVVNRHGGRVWAEGQVGAGATFFFSLPLEDT
jgi:PAS domain S-box-containing protein